MLGKSGERPRLRGGRFRWEEGSPNLRAPTPESTKLGPLGIKAPDPEAAELLLRRWKGFVPPKPRVKCGGPDEEHPELALEDPTPNSERLWDLEGNTKKKSCNS